jgi:hypothetical protein
MALTLSPVSAHLYGMRVGATDEVKWVGSIDATISISSTGSSGSFPPALSDARLFEVVARARLNMDDGLASSVVSVSFAINDGPLQGTHGSVVHSYSRAGSSTAASDSFRGNGVFSIGITDLKIPAITASFTLLSAPDATGADLYLRASSGNQSLTIKGVDFGVFVISAVRYSTEPSGWTGHLTSTNPKVQSYLTFDTRDNSYIVGVTVLLELPGVTVKLAGEKQSCNAKVGPCCKQCN